MHGYGTFLTVEGEVIEGIFKFDNYVGSAQEVWIIELKLIIVIFNI